MGLSGGVDSAYAALKLKDMGYEVVGVNLVMKQSCDSSEEASALAGRLQIDFRVIHAEKEFEEKVIRPFASAYASGFTPNPCILCNPGVKFKSLFSFADSIGAEAVATGHYAVVAEHFGRYTFSPAADALKDQGYFLYGLPQEMIKRLVLPLGGVLKSDVKAFFANNEGFQLSSGQESEDICFVGKSGYKTVVEEYAGLPPEGNFIDAEGRILGRHKGVHNYTLGQRKGLGIALGVPAYVSEVNAADNTVTLSYGAPQHRRSFKVRNLNFLSAETVNVGDRFKVRTRYRARPLNCVIEECSGGFITVSFEGEGCIAAPGQSAVFYDGSGCIAFGGTVFL